MTELGTSRVKRGLAQMLKGGVIMDVVTAEQAKIAEDAGAVAVMALERVPADIRAHGGVARMSDPDMIDGIIDAVTIPVMAKCRIGHFVEAQVLAVARRRLHRRVRGADPRRRGAPRRQARLHRPVRLRLRRPGRGPAPHRRGRRDDPHQGRGRHRQRRRGRAPHARRSPPTSAACTRSAPRSSTPRPRSWRAHGRAGPRGRRDRPAPGRDLHRRWHRHPRRRRADDAARRRGRVRRLRHLQVRRPRPPRAAPSSRPPPTSATPT